jgi:two-component system sensor histidine kinase RegB
MTTIENPQIELPSRNIRLDTLIKLRWLSVIAQTIVILVVHFVLEFELPIWGCLAVIALAAWLNVALYLRFRQAQRLEPDRAAWLLSFDIAELALLVFLTGGLENPFSFFFLGPVLIAAMALPPRMTIMLGLFAMCCTSALVFYHYPLPWSPEDRPNLPDAYIAGLWLSTVLAIFFISIYAWQVTKESQQLVHAIAAAELALVREQHMSQLDGLAAAAAHELGTPLSTISVIARELERDIDAKSPHADDIRLLREQTQRCRDILGRISQLSGQDQPFGRLQLTALLDEVAAPHRDFGITVEVHVPNDGNIELPRNPAILYGLGNIVENAVDFAHERVTIEGQLAGDDVVVTISDDGPGFAPEVINRIGEPYVRSRRKRRMYASGDTGMGLGFFIAKTLLERSGARLTFMNRPFPERGAVVNIRWPRTAFDPSPHSAGLENTSANA